MVIRGCFGVSKIYMYNIMVGHCTLSMFIFGYIVLKSVTNTIEMIQGAHSTLYIHIPWYTDTDGGAIALYDWKRCWPQ